MDHMDSRNRWILMSPKTIVLTATRAEASTVMISSTGGVAVAMVDADIEITGMEAEAATVDGTEDVATYERVRIAYL
jgi:hypothetical protein